MEVLKKEDDVSQINLQQQDTQQKNTHELKDKQLQKKNSKNQDDDSPLSNYYVIGPLGRGGGSFVYKVASIKTKEQFALKVIDKTQPKFQKQSQERLQNEIEVLS
ncbi:Protein kinase-like domain [Pseudocohnilembus persalinus]|uniref:Protein kinase-like domain n=1 Tax=Pseudocohnilembus persalinus TaxID=266149 RepID=A0A0V0R8E0_PSEPJ|nr:Protein kinase-like domain [Pseudocohnilembus persalinus]|eukprot:KRX10758.1 Protein kinase-like domain [Pseudocohnilembus persalinus]